MRLILRLIPAAALCASCADPSAPTDLDELNLGTPGISIISGANVSDTIDAPAAAVLVVEARTATGELATGRQITFRGQDMMVLVSVPDADAPGLAASVLTGADGRAAVEIWMGVSTGPAEVVVEMIEPSATYTATAGYTVEFGDFGSMQVSPNDAILTPGASLTLYMHLGNRHNHLRPAPVDQFTFIADSSAIASVSPEGVVTAHSVGRARIRALGPNGVMDTAWVSVPPVFSFAAIIPGCTCTGPDRLVLTSTDRKTLDTLAMSAWSADWHPSGDRLVFEDAPFLDGHLFAVTPGNEPARLITDVLPIDAEATPQFSGDGQWLFFSGVDLGTSSSTLWRAAADGSGAVQIGPAGVDGVLLMNPAPSHDGSRVAFVRRGASEPFNALFVLDVASGDVDSLAPRIYEARWSPGDSLIAFSDHEGRLNVIRPDGTELRTLGLPFGSNRFGPAFDWSPDGTWLLSAKTSRYLELIRLSDGFAMPLYREVFDGVEPSRPVWRP